MSRSLPGRVKREQPGLCEEGIWPAPAIALAETESRTFVLLAQDRSQPSTDEAVERGELGVVGMLEVAEPSLEQRVQAGDDAGEARAARASGPGPYAVFEAVQAFLADEVQ